ncbi:replication-relaxation family protein [Streptomyces malaysiensis]|uniref:Replication-relaxation family protein n=1 Tax=Streptomyces malaysiensis subsp. samsunensis TaxID=459658 RepID=A0A9X2M5A9_STRMQ|nr:replication-relaxation family protein [Streptomyces samsunensis]MCQ8835311.1 replication-relaxation family protein [Streptomyces samsunensis]
MPALPRPASGPGSRYTARAALTRPRPTPPRHRTDPAALARSLTARDLWITAMVHEHRVLTTPQIARIAFTSQRSAQRRLRVLHHHAVLDSFRPLTQHGSAPEHYTLGPTGVSVIAAHAGCEPAALGWRPTTTGRIAYSPSLGHDIGVNELLTHLAAPTPNATHGRLTLWLSERSCARRWDDMIRPDAYAHWHTLSTTDANSPVLLSFFLEYDTGSQSLPRVEAKLVGYAAFTTSTNTRPALLIHTHTASRDRALRHRLTQPARDLGLYVATSSADFTTHTPWGPWWAPLHPPAPRTTLTGLTTHWPHLTPATIDPTDADTALTLPIPPRPPTTPDGR